AIGLPCAIGRRAGSIAPLSYLDVLEQAVKQRLLSRNNLLFGDRDGKPLGAIDLGEALNASALWWPLQMEDITLDAAGFELALERERGNPLCPRLHYLAKGQRDAGRPDTGFFGKFAHGGRPRRLVGPALAFRDRPGTPILFGPEGASRMNEQHRNQSLLAPVHEDPCALRRHTQATSSPP